jgi:hypothetical protein
MILRCSSLLMTTCDRRRSHGVGMGARGERSTNRLPNSDACRNRRLLESACCTSNIGVPSISGLRANSGQAQDHSRRMNGNSNRLSRASSGAGVFDHLSAGIAHRRPPVCKSLPGCLTRFTLCHSALEYPGQQLVRVYAVRRLSGCVCLPWHTLGTTGVFVRRSVAFEWRLAAQSELLRSTDFRSVALEDSGKNALNLAAQPF